MLESIGARWLRTSATAEVAGIPPPGATSYEFMQSINNYAKDFLGSAQTGVKPNEFPVHDTLQRIFVTSKGKEHIIAPMG